MVESWKLQSTSTIKDFTKRTYLKKEDAKANATQISTTPPED